jgi:hypothetical protein
MAGKIRYGIRFKVGVSDLDIEMEMIRRGGQWTGKQGQLIGEGLFFHFKQFETLLWKGAKVWHRWNELQLQEYLTHRTIGILGPSSSGKTNGAATDVLADWYCFPSCTTVLICSTTTERLQDRIFGEIKKYHRMAKGQFPELPGHLIEGRLRIVNDSKDEVSDGRDFRNGIIGVPFKRGGNFQGLEDFIGIKNKRMRMIADELQMLPASFMMAISNLDKNPDLKVVGLGNPKETTDALGVFCEPAFKLGGWDGGIDQIPKTKTWETRRPGGVCIQFVGTDSPNLDGQLGIPLITQEAIDRDIAQYGKDSLQFTMMNMGMMPRGQGSRRVITRQLCLKNHATDEPNWLDGNQTSVAFLDAAYGGVGGDRCIFGVLKFGQEAEPIDPSESLMNLISQVPYRNRHRQIIALIEMVPVPINVTIDVEVTDQIVNFVQSQCSTRNIPPQNFFFDSGMRTALVSSFARLWSPLTNPIDCGGSPTDRQVSAQIEMPASKYYSKFITEMWFGIRLGIESGQFRGLKEAVISEGCAREWKMVGANKIEIETKADMKQKTGRSPDCFDGMACGFEGARRLGFIIDNLSVAKASKGTDVWKQQLKERAAKQWAESSLDYRA